MIFNGIKLPPEVGLALEDDKLVIFAGAGISLPAPSGIPLFTGLASEISGGRRVESGKEDRFLGKLHHEGTDVHALVTSRVYNSKTSPTQLHHELLRIFRAPEKVRIVTTNFDNHFSAAAGNVFGRTMPVEHCAPALPLGDDFHGLVYLHGSARIDPKSLVLTDKDFGKAYLTRGWARDFLVPLFSKYTVLFVGYSHNDVTTTYLARGLNQSEIKPRWAMVSSEESIAGKENWEHLEISTAEYPEDQKHLTNKHEPLTVFFSHWALHARESLFARVKRVKKIARGLPPESAEISEYIEYCLRHPRIARDFCAAIRHPAWVGWLHKRGMFDVFFSDKSSTADPILDHHPVLARWLCSFVRARHPEVLLELIQEHPRLTAVFSRTLAHEVWRTQEKSPDSRFSVWVSILLAHGREAAYADIWGYLLGECRLPEHMGIALKIFELLTTPMLRVQKGWDMSAFRTDKPGGLKPARSKSDFSVEWPHDADNAIADAWVMVLRPRLPEIAVALVPIVYNQVSTAHHLLHGVGRASERSDLLSMGRRSIAAHDQDDDPLERIYSVLIDILRDALEMWMKSHPLVARAHTELWWGSGMPIVRRLAAHAYAFDGQYSADERLVWVLRNDLVFRSGMKKEIFDVLATAFPKASRACQQRLLRRIARGYVGPGAKNLGAETIAYEKFNVLVWLRRADPKSELVKQALNVVHEANPRFAEREYPNLDAWHSKAGFIDPTEGVDFDRILREPPGQYLLAFRSPGNTTSPRDSWDYFSNLSVLFERDRIWAHGFVVALVAEPAVDAEIWGAVFSAWRQITKTHADWVEVLTIIEGLPRHEAIYASAANFIEQLAWNAEIKADEASIDRAAILMDTAWELCSANKEKPDSKYRDWLNSAINHVGGWIGEFWIHHTSFVGSKVGEKVPNIPSATKAKMIEALKGTNRVKVYARIAMTPWMAYIYNWDRSFAIEHFLPLLDWERDPVVAQQSWSVTLNYARGSSREMDGDMIPYYRKMLIGTTEKTDQFDADTLKRLGQHLAGLAMQVIPDPLESGFFQEFLPSLPESVRGDLADGMGRHLERIDDPTREKLWNTWLRKYLDQRIVGVPVALSVHETKHMIEWCLHLGLAFPEAVDRVTQMRIQNASAYGIITKLLKSAWLDKFPTHACRLAIAAISAKAHGYLVDDAVKVHDHIEKLIPDSPELKALAERLYLDGWDPKGGRS